MFATMHDTTAAPAARAAARHDLIVRNLPLLPAALRTIRPRGVDPQDVFGWGRLALVGAVDAFRPELGYKFSTYARTVIPRVVREWVRDCEHLVRVPKGPLNPRTRARASAELLAAADAATRRAAPLLAGYAGYRRPRGEAGEPEVSRRVATELAHRLLQHAAAADAELVARWYGLDDLPAEPCARIAARAGESRRAAAARFARALARLTVTAADLQPVQLRRETA